MPEAAVTPCTPADRKASVALAVGGTLGTLALRPLLGLWGALGTDAPLWGLTARDLLVGASPLVPPLYPALLAPFVAAGVSPVTAGAWVSAASIGALLVLGFRLARLLEASVPVAVGVALVPLLLPDILGFGTQLQPDATAAAGGLLLAVLLVRHHLRASARTALGLVAIAGVLPMLREHGLVWSGVGAGGLLLGPAQFRWTALFVPVAMWVAPILTGVLPGTHPLDVPWSDRAGGALSAFTTHDPTTLSFLHELHRGDREAYSAMVRSADRLGQLRWHVERSLRLAPDAWTMVVLATVLGLREATRRSGRRWVVSLLPLVAALPALLIWSQRRHVVLVAPLALVVLGTVATRKRWTAGAGLVALALHAALNGPNMVRAWQSERPRAEHYAQIGDWLSENTVPGDLLGGVHQDIGLYAPALPRHDPDGTVADWRTFYVTDRTPPARAIGTWTRVFAGPQLGIWQLDPDRHPRPCTHVDPPADSAHLAVGTAHADLTGCQEPPAP